MSRASNGLPLLFNHDTDQPIGRLEEVGLRKDGRLGAMARFSKNPRAQEVLRDIEDGILTDVSIGYRIDAWTEARDGEDSTYTATRWTPMEGSIVPVPADHTVGVGRSASRFASDVQGATGELRDAITLHKGHMDGSVPTDTASQQKMMDQMVAALAALDSDGMGVGRSADLAAHPVIPTPEPVPATGKEHRMSDAAAPAAGEQKVAVVAETRDKDGLTNDERNKMLAATAEHFRSPELLPKWISEGYSLEQARKDLEAKHIKEATAQKPEGFIDFSDKEEKSYNIARALMQAADGTLASKGGIEWEASKAIAQKMGTASRSGASFFMPMNIRVPMTRASVTGNITATNSLGGYAVETTLVSFIEIFRNRMQVRQLGATVLGGLQGNLAIPRQITANTFNWVGENPSSANTLGSLTIDQVTLSPKVGMVSTAYSRLALVQTTPDIGTMVMTDLAKVVAIGLDSAALIGTGSSSQPKGIVNQTSVGTRAIGTNGGNLDWANAVGYETDVAVANADINTLAFLTTPGVRGKAKNTLKTTVAGADFLWAGDNTINGYRAEVSNQLSTNLTKGTSTTICHQLLFGNWSEILIGEWGGAVEFQVNPYTYATQNMIAVDGWVNTDIAVRHPKSFVYTADLTIV